MGTKVGDLHTTLCEGVQNRTEVWSMKKIVTKGRKESENSLSLPDVCILSEQGYSV